MAAAENQTGSPPPSGELVNVRELVEHIVRSLVDYPDQVRCHEVEGTHSCVLELEVAREDVGKVIGKRGIHADAIRRIVTAVGGKNKKRYVLEILEDR
ncbi:MAG: KH domain-containing protein [Pseudomonadota bacterium]